jgi:hypothetical protein
MKVAIVLLLTFLVYSTFAKSIRRNETPKKVKEYTCYAYADPHYGTFSGKTYNYYGSGWRTFYHGNGVTCKTYTAHSTQWGQYSVNKHITCTHRNGQKFEAGKFYSVTNGKRVNSNYHKWKAPGIRLTVQSFHLPRGDFYLNIFLYSTSNKGYGLCVHPSHLGNPPKPKMDEAGIKLATKVCAQFKGTGTYKGCFSDVAISHNARMAGQLERFQTHILHNYKRVCRGRVCHYYKIHKKIIRVKVPYYQKVWRYRWVTKTRRVSQHYKKYYYITVADHKRRSYYRRQEIRFAKLSKSFHNKAICATKRIRKFRWAKRFVNKRYRTRVRYLTTVKKYKYVTKHVVFHQHIHSQKV